MGNIKKTKMKPFILNVSCKVSLVHKEDLTEDILIPYNVMKRMRKQKKLKLQAETQRARSILKRELIKLLNE